MRPRLIPLLAAVAAYGLSLGSGVHFDDSAIVAAPAVASGGHFLSMWLSGHLQPLTWLTFRASYLIGGSDVLGYHLFSLLLHLAAVALLFECLRQKVPERAAMIGAAIFAAHPMASEAVNSLSARSYELGAVLALACLLAWWKQQRWLALLWFALAVLAREECAAMIFVLPLVTPGELRKSAAPLVAMAGLAAAGLARALAGHAAAADWMGRYFLAQGASILRYVRLLVIPYGYSAAPGITTPGVAVGICAWLAVGALVWLAWHYGRESWGRWVVAGMILLAPTSSVFPSQTLASDARMYLPLAAFAAGAALLLGRWKSPVPGLAVVAVLAVLAVVRCAVWMDEERLWREAVQRAPQSAAPKLHLARVVKADEALELLNRAGLLEPNDPAIPAEMGRRYLLERQYDPALTQLSRAVALAPANAEYLNYRGVAFQALGMYVAARTDYRHAVALDPDFSAAKENLQKLGPVW
jgi:protein O-mannosyl-transferase